MRRLTMMALALLLMLNTVPAFSQEEKTPQERQEKYLCELQAGNCVKRIDVIQRKLNKMQADVKEGKKTYSAEELQKIEQKLQEVEQMLDNMKAK